MDQMQFLQILLVVRHELAHVVVLSLVFLCLYAGALLALFLFCSDLDSLVEELLDFLDRF